MGHDRLRWADLHQVKERLALHCKGKMIAKSRRVPFVLLSASRSGYCAWRADHLVAIHQEVISRKFHIGAVPAKSSLKLFSNNLAVLHVQASDAFLSSEKALVAEFAPPLIGS